VDAAGWVALLLAPGLAFIGILIGKAVEARTAKDNTALAMVGILTTRLDVQERRAEMMEDYALDLRRVLMTAGTDVPPWPDD
jgi:Ca2+/H+ antiporter